ncbi:hypothetical protein PROFUN_13283, partial [Planoprotostelium fungivorum]
MPFARYSMGLQRPETAGFTTSYIMNFHTPRPEESTDGLELFDLKDAEEEKFIAANAKTSEEGGGTEELQQRTKTSSDESSDVTREDPARWQKVLLLLDRIRKPFQKRKDQKAPEPERELTQWEKRWKKVSDPMLKYLSYVGPGLVVAVAYMDPGNFGTDLAAGSGFGYDLLFVVLLSSVIACFLQALALRLGAVTGLNLAQVCQREMPTWLKWICYLAMEAAIISTDFAE